jgi:hypothetical protein
MLGRFPPLFKPPNWKKQTPRPIVASPLADRRDFTASRFARSPPRAPLLRRLLFRARIFLRWFPWRYRLGVRTPDSQSGNPGSIPGTATTHLSPASHSFSFGRIAWTAPVAKCVSSRLAAQPEERSDGIGAARKNFPGRARNDRRENASSASAAAAGFRSLASARFAAGPAFRTVGSARRGRT